MEKIYIAFDENVVSDVFGDEVVIVNLQTGVYFSLQSTAASIWKLLMDAYSVKTIIDTYSVKFIEDQVVISETILSFVSDLETNQLIKVTADLQENTQTIDLGNIASFIAPKIEQFNDMQDILLLDPVHDVDAQGWPLTKEDN